MSNDWVVALGLEDSKVQAGLDAIEARIKKMESLANNASGKPTNSKPEVANTQKLVNLEKQRLAIRKEALSLVNRGVITQQEYGGLKGNLAQAKSAETLDKIRQGLHQKEITRSEEAMRSKIQQGKLDAKLSAEAIAREKVRQALVMRQRVAAFGGGLIAPPQVSTNRAITQTAIAREGLVKAEREAYQIEKKREDVLYKINELLQKQYSFSRMPKKDQTDFIGRLGSIQGQQQALLGKAQATTSISDLDKLNREYGKVANSTRMFEREVNQLNNRLKFQEWAAKGLRESITHLARSYLSIFTVIQGSRAFFTIGRDMQSVQATMLVASGTAEQAGKDYEWLIGKARYLGADIQQLASSFAKFGAAGVASNLTLEKTKEIFNGIVEVNTAFQLSTEDAGLSFLAFEQMLSKGVVSTQELRRQLGERWFGVFTQAANAMGIGTQELDKLIASGKLKSVEFVPKLVSQMQKIVKETGAFQAALKKVASEQKRFGSEIKIAINEAFTGNEGAFAAFFKDVTMLAVKLKPLFNVFGFVLSGVGRALSMFGLIAANIFKPVIWALETVTKMIKNGFDTSKAIKELTAMEKVVRLLGLAFLSVAWAIAKITEQLSDWGVSGDSTAGQVISIVAVTALISRLVMFTAKWTGMLWAFRAVLNGLLRVPTLAKLLQKVGVDKFTAKAVSKTASTYGKPSSVLGKSSIASGAGSSTRAISPTSTLKGAGWFAALSALFGATMGTVDADGSGSIGALERTVGALQGVVDSLINPFLPSLESIRVKDISEVGAVATDEYFDRKSEGLINLFDMIWGKESAPSVNMEATININTNSDNPEAISRAVQDSWRQEANKLLLNPAFKSNY